jgi:hypothetical protein
MRLRRKPNSFFFLFNTDIKNRKSKFAFNTSNNLAVNIVKIGISLIKRINLSYAKRRGELINMRVDTTLIRLSITLFLAGMVLRGLVFLPITDISSEAQIETCAAYVMTASLVTLAIVGISSIFKNKL